MMRFHHTLARLFPPPQFIALPSVGVDVSDTSLKYIRFERAKHELSLHSWGDLPIPDGVITQGVVKNPTALASVIKEASEKAGTECIRLSLPEERAYLFEMPIKKNLSAAEVRDAIEFHLEENVPLSPRDAEFDYSLTPRESGEEQMAVVTVFSRETVASYAEACERAKVLPLSFEVEAQALARSVVAKNSEETHLIVDFGKTRTGIGIASRGLLQLTSTVDIGGKDLDAALIRAYPAADFSELVRLKNEYGVIVSTEEPAVRDALLPSITSLKNEILARISYWNTRHEKKEHQIQRVILCGGIANLAGLTATLNEALSLPIEQAEVWKNAFSLKRCIPPITRRYSYGYATAIGLALAGFDDTDL